jgi:HEPN domain-containing protein
MDEARERLSQSEYDLETAQAMLDSRRYIYAVFMCHMTVEKALKALVVKRTGDAPPRTHNLVQLVGLASLLSSAGVSTRYPEELSKALDDYPPTVVQEYVTRAGEVVQCLKNQVS